jgi:hypothetical protein
MKSLTKKHNHTGVVIILIVFILLLQNVTFAQAQSVIINIETAGTLASMIGSKADTITDLTVSGPLKSDDFRTIRNMDKLQVLNLSGVTIVQDLANYSWESTWANTISNRMFLNLKLISVKIPNNVTRIDYGAFLGCNDLTEILVGEENNYFSSFEGVLFNKDKTTLILFPCSKSKNYSIPNCVTRIDYGAFSRCTGLTSVTIPNSVTNIANFSFYGCTGLVEFIVDTENINFSSFEGVLFNKDKSTLISFPNSKSNNYSIPNSVTSVGNEAFLNCLNLESITIPKSINEFMTGSVYGCTSLSEFIVDAENINFSSFEGVLFNKDKSTLISFPNAKSKNYSIPNSATNIGNSAFAGCTSLTSILIPNSVTYIGGAAFAGCTSLTSVLIPNSVTNIDYGAFYMCTKMTKITISENLTTIKAATFAACDALTSINLKGTVPYTLELENFNESIFNNCILIVPKGSLELYRNADGWKNFVNIVEDISTLSIKIPSEELEISLYPNPASNQIKIDFIRSIEPAVIEIYDKNGRIVLRKEISHENYISVGQLNRGQYIYKLSHQNKISVGKILLQ